MADEKVDRRDFLKEAALVSSGIAYLSLEEKALLASPPEAAGVKPATGEIAPVKDFPVGKIGNVSISRLICGGNLISGFAHCRDLLYVSELLRNYFTDEKVMETFRLCEANGINTAVLRLDKHCVSILEKYRKQGGRIQWIVQVSPQEINSIKHDIKWAVDSGAIGAYLHGGAADRWVLEGNRVDLIEQFVKFTREQGIIVGVGAHSIEVPIAVHTAGIDPDFYVKTLHSENYWSARRPEQQEDVINNPSDNYWSVAPERTIEFMKEVKQPWLAFKVLAAGAIHPKDGFKFAYENGADFVLAGMFDFQVAQDAQIARQIIAAIKDRPRPWRG